MDGAGGVASAALLRTARKLMDGTGQPAGYLGQGHLPGPSVIDGAALP